MVSAAGDFVYAKFSEINVIILFDPLAIFTITCNESVRFSFLFHCFFFVKDQIASFFSIKANHCVLNYVFRVCVFFIA